MYETYLATSILTLRVFKAAVWFPPLEHLEMPVSLEPLWENAGMFVPHSLHQGLDASLQAPDVQETHQPSSDKIKGLLWYSYSLWEYSEQPEIFLCGIWTQKHSTSMCVNTFEKMY